MSNLTEQDRLIIEAGLIAWPEDTNYSTDAPHLIRALAQERNDAEARVKILEELMVDVYNFILSEYESEEAAALEGSPIAKPARDLFNRICKVL